MTTAHILIADDDPVVRHILSSILTASGHASEAVESGVKCIAKIRDGVEHSRIPKLLFLDLQLTDMTGAEVLQQLQGILGSHSLPVIVLSANSREEAQRTYPTLAADHFLEKPFSPQAVLEALAQLGIS